MVWRSNRARNILGTQVIEEFSSDTSEGEFVEPEKPWPPERASRPRERAPRYPRPHSHLFRTYDGRRARGNKHVRRWENSMYLSSLHQIPEEEISEGFSILPPHTSPFTQLFNNDKYMQIWCSFTSRSEEDQRKILSSSTLAKRKGVRGEGVRGGAVREGVRGGAVREEGVKGEAVSGDEAYRRIDRHIRAVMQHNKHLPLALLKEIEDELCFHFTNDFKALVVILQAQPFYRLLIHGVCHYLGLASTTERCEGVDMMVVESRENHFLPPATSLSFLLQQKRKHQ